MVQIAGGVAVAQVVQVGGPPGDPGPPGTDGDPGPPGDPLEAIAALEAESVRVEERPALGGAWELTDGLLALRAGVLREGGVGALVTLVTAAIVDGAPATLDTLNELAAALGDNANLAADITDALTLKANLAGGNTFTGLQAMATASFSGAVTFASTAAFSGVVTGDTGGTGSWSIDYDAVGNCHRFQVIGTTTATSAAMSGNFLTLGPAIALGSDVIYSAGAGLVSFSTFTAAAATAGGHLVTRNQAREGARTTTTWSGTTATLVKGANTFTGSAATVATTPAIASNTDTMILVENRGSAMVTVTAAASLTLWDRGALATTVAVGPGDWCELHNDGTYWVVTRPHRQAHALTRAGGYYAWPPRTSHTTDTPSVNRLQAHAFLLGRSALIDRIACYCTTGGSAGSVLRFGVYANDPTSDVPGVALYRSGTVASTGSGMIEATGLALTLQPGLYWVAVVAQVAVPILRASATMISTLPTSGDPGTTTDCAYAQASVSGALPDPFGTPSAQIGTTPMVGLYRA